MADDVNLGTMSVTLKGEFGVFLKELNTAIVSIQGVTKKIEDFSQKMGNRLAPEADKGTAAIKQVGVATVAAGNLLANFATQAMRLMTNFATTSLKAGIEFERIMSAVGAVTGASTLELNKMATAAKAWGGTTVYSATEVAKAMELFAKAGFSVKDTLSAMEGALLLAAAGDLSLATAVDYANSFIHTFNLEASEMTRIANALAFGANETNVEVSELGESLKYAGPIAAQLGLDLEESITALSMLSNFGLKASLAGTTLRQSLMSLVDPTKEVKDILKAHNIELRDADLKMKSLFDIIKSLKEAALDPQEAFKVLGARGSGLALLMQLPIDAMDKFKQKMMENSDYASEIATKKLDNFSGDLTKLANNIQKIGIEVFGGMSDGLRKLTQSFFDFFKDVSPEKWQAVGKEIGNVFIWFRDNSDFLITNAKAIAVAIGLIFASSPVGQAAILLAGLETLIVTAKKQAEELGDTYEKFKESINNGTKVFNPLLGAFVDITNAEELNIKTTKEGIIVLEQYYNGAKKWWKGIEDAAVEANSEAAKAQQKLIDKTVELIKDPVWAKYLENVTAITEKYQEQIDTANIALTMIPAGFKAASDEVKKMYNKWTELLEQYYILSKAKGKEATTQQLKELHDLAEDIITLNKSTQEQIRKDKDAERELEAAKQRRQAIETANTWAEVAEAFKKSQRKIFDLLGDTMESFSSEASTALTSIFEGESAREAMDKLWKDMKSSFYKNSSDMLVQMLLDWAATLAKKLAMWTAEQAAEWAVSKGYSWGNTLTSWLGGSSGASTGTTAATSAGTTAATSAGTTAATSAGTTAATSAGTTAVASTGSEAGSGLSAGATTAGYAVGAYLGYEGYRTGNEEMSAAGGATIGATYGSNFGPWGAAIGAIIGGAIGYVGGELGKKDESRQATYGTYMEGVIQNGWNPQAAIDMGETQQKQGIMLQEEGVYVDLGNKLKAFGDTLKAFGEGTASSTEVIATAKDALIQHLSDTGGEFGVLDANLQNTIISLGGTVTNADYFKAAIQGLGYTINDAGKVCDSSGKEIKDFGFYVDKSGNIIDKATGEIKTFASVQELFAAVTSKSSDALQGMRDSMSGIINTAQGAVYGLNNTANSLRNVSKSAKGQGIQGYAEGGIIQRPTIAAFAESGPELALPLSKAPEILSKVLNNAGMSGNSGKVINVNFTGTNLFTGNKNEMDRFWREGIKWAAERDPV